MKRVLLIVAVLAIMASSAAQAITLINDSLDTTPPGAWTKVGTGSDAGKENDRGLGGDWNVGGSDGSGGSAAYDNYYYQKFMYTGTARVEASGLSKVWAGWWSGENWGWLQEARIELLIDGVKVADGVAQNSAGLWDTWIPFSYSDVQTINSDIELRLHSVKGNNNNGGGSLGAIWWASRYDDITLSVNPVPEPSSLLALFTGAAGMVGFVIRRKS